MSTPVLSRGSLPVGRPATRRGVLVIATVGAGTPALRNVDWIRIDGAQGPLEALADRRARHDVPALFDVPGPRTRRTGSLLTTSEYLVFAAAEGFEWVNLRGVHHPEEIERAREFLHPATRLSVTVASPSLIARSLGALCERADAILFARAELQAALGPNAADRALFGAMHTALVHGTPPLVGTGALPSMHLHAHPRAEDVHALADLVDEGARGIVLTRETVDGADPQGAVDVARLVVDEAPPDPPIPSEPRPAARVAGRVSVVGHDAHARPRPSAH